MHTSTPLNRDRENLRKSIALRDITNSNKSKKRLSNIVNQTPTAQFEVDDELERSIRRNEADIQKRLSNISVTQSPQIGNEKEIKEHFQVCLKMFAENRISSKNAWNLKIIDYMRTVLQSQGVVKNSLQVASTSLDASAKIYGIRVDDIHSEGLKLANNMARLGAQKEIEMNNEDEDRSDKENEEGATKKKKRKITRGPKATIVKDRNSLVQPLTKVESGFFQTRTNLELSCTNNLFTKKLSLNHGGYTFILLNKDKAWPTYAKEDPNINFDKSYSFNLPTLKNFQTCTPFANFVIDEWDPDQEDNLIPTQEPVADEEVVFDEDGVPVPELDGSIHDLFANGVDHMSSDGEEEEIPIGHAAIKTNSVARIVDFRPTICDAEPNDYTFMNSVKMNNNKLITQIWAGPSHWKLKHVRPAVQRCAGVAEKQATRPAKRVRVQPTVINYSDTNLLTKDSFYKVKRAHIDEDPCKCTLPEVLYDEMSSMRSLMVRPVYISTNLQTPNEESEDAQNVEPYNYENPNDSLYCSQHGGDDDGDDNQMEDGEFQQESLRPTQNFLGDNLIDVPQIIENTYIPYALKAKKMDMKKLKVAVWKTLVAEKVNEHVSDEKMYEKKVEKTRFSNVYEQIPHRITENMKEELSAPLAFVALLHLCNEQNLLLTGQGDRKDVLIEQTKHFQDVPNTRQ